MSGAEPNEVIQRSRVKPERGQTDTGLVCCFSPQEYFDQAHDLFIKETELRQVAYVFCCSNSTLQIEGKINSIIVGEFSHLLYY